MRARIVRVNHVYCPRAHSSADLSRGSNVPVGTHRNRGDGQTFCARPFNKRRFGSAYEERLMTQLPKTERQKKDLSLTPAPAGAGIEMQDPKPLHPSASRSANALKIPRSHGSGESFISSGCHCTATTHHSFESDSTPSMIPSGARAVTRSPGATSLML